MRPMSARQVRNLRRDQTGVQFGDRVRRAVAEILGVEPEQLPEVTPRQVARWERRGLKAHRLSSVVYLLAMRRLQERERK